GAGRASGADRSPEWPTLRRRRAPGSRGTADVINCSRCTPKSCRIRKARCDRTRSRHQVALHPVGEGLAGDGTAERTVGGRPQRFGAKGKIRGATLFVGISIKYPYRFVSVPSPTAK